MWQHISESALVEVMAYCLLAPRHYLKQCRHISKYVLWHSPDSNLPRNVCEPPPWYMFKGYTFNNTSISPSAIVLIKESLTLSLLLSYLSLCPTFCLSYPDSKVHGANMEPIWGQQDPDGSHVGLMKFAVWVLLLPCYKFFYPVLYFPLSPHPLSFTFLEYMCIYTYVNVLVFLEWIGICLK